MKRLRGIAASRGIASGPAFRFQRTALEISQATIEDPAAEWGRLEGALEMAGRQLEEVQAQAEAQSGAEQAAIFEAQRLMLEDPELLDAVRTSIEGEKLNAVAALSRAIET